MIYPVTYASLDPVSVVPAAEKHLQHNRTYQGIPALTRTPKGRLLAAWYAGGSGEGAKNYVGLALSDDDGISWSDMLYVVDPQHDMLRTFDPALWCAPDGRVFLYYSQSSAGECGKKQIFDGIGGVWQVEITEPDAPKEKLKFTAPVRIFNGIMLNEPSLLLDNSWVLPCSVWSDTKDYTYRKHPSLGVQQGAFMVVSDDAGKTFQQRGRIDPTLIPGGAQFDEQRYLQRSNGEIVCFMRCVQGIAEFVSQDNGATWSRPRIRTDFTTPGSRFYLNKLPSGAWLLVRNDSADCRKNLTAYLSDDEGRSWSAGLLIDERINTAYPAGAVTADGNIYIAYDRERYEGGFIYLAKFSEDAIRRQDTTSIRKSLISSTRPI